MSRKMLKKIATWELYNFTTYDPLESNGMETCEVSDRSEILRTTESSPQKIAIAEALQLILHLT